MANYTSAHAGADIDKAVLSTQNLVVNVASDLTSLDVSTISNRIVMVRGNAAANDGKGGPYYYDSTTASSVADGVDVVASSDSKVWRRCSEIEPTATMAALITCNPVVAMGRRLQGYYSRNDGGEGNFYWVDGDTTTANGGTVIASTFSGHGLGEASEGRWHRLYYASPDVKAGWFGMKEGSSMSSADQTINFEALRDANNLRSNLKTELILPRGRYEYNDTWRLNYDSDNNTGHASHQNDQGKTYIRGCGAPGRSDYDDGRDYGTTLVYTGTSGPGIRADRKIVRSGGAVDHVNSGRGQRVTNIRLQGFSLHAASITSGYAMELPWFHNNCLLEDIYIVTASTGASGLLIGGSFSSEIRDVFVDSQAGASLALSKTLSNFGLVGIRHRNGRDTMVATEQGGGGLDLLDEADEPGGSGGMVLYENVTVRNFRHGFLFGGLYYGRHKQDFDITAGAGTTDVTVRCQVEAAKDFAVGTGDLEVLRLEFAVPASTVFDFGGGKTFTVGGSSGAAGDYVLTGTLTGANIDAGDTATYAGDFTAGFSAGHTFDAIDSSNAFLSRETVSSVAFSGGETIITSTSTVGGTATVARSLIAQRVAKPVLRRCQAANCRIGLEAGWLCEAITITQSFFEWNYDCSIRIARGCEAPTISDSIFKTWQISDEDGSVRRNWTIASMTANSITITGGQTLHEDMVAGNQVEIKGNAGASNDGLYTISSISGQIINVNETITTPGTTDGYVMPGGQHSAAHIVIGYDPYSEAGRKHRAATVTGNSFWQSAYTMSMYAFGGEAWGMFVGPSYVRLQGSDSTGARGYYLDGTHTTTTLHRPKFFGFTPTIDTDDVVNPQKAAVVYGNDANNKGIQVHRPLLVSNGATFEDADVDLTDADVNTLLGSVHLKTRTRRRYRILTSSDSPFSIVNTNSGARPVFLVDTNAGNVIVNLPALAGNEGSGDDTDQMEIEIIHMRAGNTMDIRCDGYDGVTPSTSNNNNRIVDSALVEGVTSTTRGDQLNLLAFYSGASAGLNGWLKRDSNL